MAWRDWLATGWLGEGSPLSGATVTVSDTALEASEVFSIDDHPSTHLSPNFVFDGNSLVLTWVDNRQAPGSLDLFSKVLPSQQAGSAWADQTSFLLSPNASVPASTTQGEGRSLMVYQDFVQGAHRVRAKFVNTLPYEPAPQDAGPTETASHDGGVATDDDNDQAIEDEENQLDDEASPPQPTAPDCGCNQAQTGLLPMVWFLLGLFGFKIRPRRKPIKPS